MPRPSNPRAPADALPAMGNGGLYGSPLMHLRGIPYLLALGRKAKGMACLAPSTSIFEDLKSQKLDAATRDESAATLTQGSLGARFWG